MYSEFTTQLHLSCDIPDLINYQIEKKNTVVRENTFSLYHVDRSIGIVILKNTLEVCTKSGIDPHKNELESLLDMTILQTIHTSGGFGMTHNNISQSSKRM